MITQTLASSPSLQHGFTQLIDFVGEAIIRVSARELGRCAFEDQDCDCRQPAVVHLLGSDYDYCLDHFRKAAL